MHFQVHLPMDKIQVYLYGFHCSNVLNHIFVNYSFLVFNYPPNIFCLKAVYSFHQFTLLIYCVCYRLN